MRNDSQARQLNSESSNDKQSVYLSIDFQCWKIEQRNLIPGEMELLEEGPEVLPDKVGSEVELQQTGKGYAWQHDCREDEVQKP